MDHTKVPRLIYPVEVNVHGELIMVQAVVKCNFSIDKRNHYLGIDKDDNIRIIYAFDNVNFSFCHYSERHDNK